MNVEGTEFSLGKTYEVDDIVYISEISSSSVEQSIVANGIWALGPSHEEFFKDSDLIVSVYLKRSIDAAAGFESYTKFVTNDLNEFDSSNSEGVGIGLQFKDSGGDTVDTLGRLVPYGNIPVSNYKCIKFIVKKSEIPSTARTVRPIALASSISAGSFTFKNVDLQYVNKYFYCIQENTSAVSNQPSSDDGTDYWTKSFLWRPSYGAKFNFSNLIKRKNLGDGYKKTCIEGLNSMKLEINYSFPNLTTKRASAIINFLQQSTEVTRSSFDADDRGDPLVSSLIDYLNLELPFPYKNKDVVVRDFSHEENYLNNHTVQVTFLCDKESNLENIESYAAKNSSLDQSSVINLDSPVNLTKEEEAVLQLKSIVDGSSNEKSNVLLKNYIKGTLGAISSGGVNSIRFTPSIDYSIESDADGMEIIFPFLKNSLRHSIFIDDVSNLEYYPYNKIRTLSFPPDLDFSISNQPLDNQTSLGSEYNLYIKKDLNSNLIEIDLTFSRRSDQEIKFLLFFLESHLGYLPFRFKTPEIYNNKEENQNFKKQINRVFYCPSWSHSYIYKNNHSLRANFIEYSLPTE